MRRLLHVARVLVTPWPAVLAAPWLIMVCSLAVNEVTFAAIGGQVPGPHNTGGLLSLYVSAYFFAASAVHQTIPFALGLSVTRRACAAAAGLVAAAQALGGGVLLYLLRRIEDASGGWGEDLRFFGLPFVTEHNPVLQILVYAVPLLVVLLLGGLCGLVHLRWANLGVTVLTLATLAAGGLGTVLITRLRAWHTVGRWFTDSPAAAVWAGWPLLLVALLLAGGYLSMRRMPVN